MRPWKEIENEIKTMHRKRREESERNWSKCFHPENFVEYRRKVISDGRFQLRKQCLKCGELFSGNYPFSTVADKNSVPLVDSFLEEQSQKRNTVDYTKLREEEVAEINIAFWEYYDEYLQSAQWFEIRKMAIERAQGKCEGCGIKRIDHIHHRTYDHLGDEMLFEMLALCKRCHEKVHDKEIA